MKLIIAGSRSASDIREVYAAVSAAFKHWGRLWEKRSEIVCGMARGADLLGKQFGDEGDMIVREFPADWAKHGKSAGFIRNQEMVDYADAAIYLWDGKSKGTKDCIDRAKKKGMPIYIHRI